MADQMQRGAAIRQKSFEDTHATLDRRGITPRQAARSTARGARTGVLATTRRSSSTSGSKHLLTAELVVGLVIVLIRIVAEYEPQADGTVKGKVLHPKGQYGPLPITAGLVATFFVLSFLVAHGGRSAKVANSLGGLVVLVLLLKSKDDLDKVTATFGDWGKAKLPPGAWETSGVAAGEPISGTLGDDTSSGTYPTTQKAQSKLAASLPLGAALPGGGINLGSAAANNAEQAAMRAGWDVPSAIVDYVNAGAQGIAPLSARAWGEVERFFRWHGAGGGWSNFSKLWDDLTAGKNPAGLPGHPATGVASRF